MTKERFPKPKYWLDVSLCEHIYKIYKTHQKTLPGSEPLPDFACRFEGLLENILDSVKLKSDLLGFDIADTAACYYLHLTKSQALLNGNKRMGLVFTDVFLFLNGLELTIQRDKLSDLSILLALDIETPLDDLENDLRKLFQHICTKSK